MSKSVNKGKINRILLVFSVILLIISAGILVLDYQAQEKNSEIISDESSIEKQLVKTQKEYEKKLAKTKKETMDLGEKSSNSSVKYVYEYDSLLNQATDTVNSFFKIYHTWDSLDQYQSRPSKLGNFAAPDLLTNEDIFDSGLDTTGGDMIAALDLSSSFKSAETTVVNTDDEASLMVTVKVQVKEGSKQVIKEIAYDLQYNQADKKIVSLKKLTALENT